MSDPIPDLTNLQEWNSFCEKSMTVLEVLTLLNNRHRDRMAEVITNLNTVRAENRRLAREKAEARENLRDRFAMAALSGEIASTSTEESAGAIARAAIATGREPALHIAITCYELADAMLAARKPAAEEDPHQTEDYQRHVAKTAEGCEAGDPPCDACLAGGVCDGPSTEGGDS